MMKKITLINSLFIFFLITTGCKITDDEVLKSQPIHLISNFDPSSGSPGTTVIISGMYFDSIPENNEVSFGGAKAEVLEASETTLKVVVPPAARTGKISLTIKGITSLSQSQFLVKE